MSRTDEETTTTWTRFSFNGRAVTLHRTTLSAGLAPRRPLQLRTRVSVHSRCSEAIRIYPTWNISKTSREASAHQNDRGAFTTHRITSSRPARTCSNQSSTKLTSLCPLDFPTCLPKANRPQISNTNLRINSLESRVHRGRRNSNTPFRSSSSLSKRTALHRRVRRLFREHPRSHCRKT